MSLLYVLENERLAYLSTGNNGMVDEFDSCIVELKTLQKENDKLKKEVEYWKLSFNKQVEASRQKDNK